MSVLCQEIRAIVSAFNVWQSDWAVFSLVKTVFSHGVIIE